MNEFTNRLKLAARCLAYGRTSKFYEDEHVSFSITPLTPCLDQTETDTRINVITPSLSKSGAFGGISTLTSIPLEILKAEEGKQDLSVRFICTGDEPPAGDNIALHLADRLGVNRDRVALHYRGQFGKPVPVAANDIFLGSLWHSQYAAMPLLKFQHQQFSGDPKPYVALVQDYEPGFYPWSSAYVLAQASYDIDWPRKLVFNSSELADFYRSRGHKCEDFCVFEPKLNLELKDALEADSPPEKERRILFYGRPDERRNCFFVGREALQIWSQTYDKAHKWAVISAGANYEAFELANGASLSVLGKLTLAGYAEELHKAAVGLSLMASPHPSYPPLEMSHFGALTVCNNFEHKDTRKWHENLRPVSAVDPENVAKGLIEACKRFEENPRIGLEGKSLKPQYLKGSDKAEFARISEFILS